MKRISYRIVVSEPGEELVLQPIRRRCYDSAFEEQYAIAQSEAYNGEVTVEDVPDPVTEPTQLDAIEAQVTYTALMTDTLLEEV